MTSRTPRIITTICCVVIGLGFILASIQVHAFRGSLEARQMRARALMVDPTLLKIVSGNFRGLLADYLLIKAAIFKGGAHETTDEDWQAMYMLFKQSTALDPYFKQTGYYTQGMMAWRQGLHEKAIEILTPHAEARQWDWEPMFYLGFDYAYYLHDYAKSAEYLRRAAERPNSPSIVANLATRMSQQAGKTITAIAMLKSMIERTDDEEAKENLVARLKAYLGIHQLEQALDTFIPRYGRRPSSLDELVKAGILEELPPNTMGDKYYYDAETGKIDFLNPSK